MQDCRVVGALQRGLWELVRVAWPMDALSVFIECITFCRTLCTASVKFGMDCVI